MSGGALVTAGWHLAGYLVKEGAAHTGGRPLHRAVGHRHMLLGAGNGERGTRAGEPHSGVNERVVPQSLSPSRGEKGCHPIEVGTQMHGDGDDETVPGMCSVLCPVPFYGTRLDCSEWKEDERGGAWGRCDDDRILFALLTPGDRRDSNHIATTQ